MKSPLVLLASLLLFVSLACNLPLTATPSPVPPTEPPTLPPATEPPLPTTEPPAEPTSAPDVSVIPVVFDRLSLIIPPGLASGGSGESFPRAEGDNIAPWEVTPGHIRVCLDGYALKNTFHDPCIFVYPAQDYANLSAGAAESIERLQKINANPSAPIAAENLPFIPFFNAGAQFATSIFPAPFKNGMGVRFLTQYGRDVSPTTNEGLFYQFQGLTSDGEYYIIAILPINHPYLPASFEAPLPEGGIPFPDYNDPKADFAGYYNQVAEMLKVTLAGAFTPHLENLDFVIRSITVTP